MWGKHHQGAHPHMGKVWHIIRHPLERLDFIVDAPCHPIGDPRMEVEHCRVSMLTHEAQASKVFLSPASFVFYNLLKRANGERLARTVKMNGHAPAVLVFEKTGCTFASCKGKPVSLERRHQATGGEPTEPCIVNGHGG